MKASISRVDIFSANIPFKTKFRHASNSRDKSESIFVRLEMEGGQTGFGESLPRPYVTGESQARTLLALKEAASRFLPGRTFQSFEEVVEFLSSFKRLSGAGKCAFELALLDSAAKVFGCSVAYALGGARKKRLRYGAAIGKDSVSKTKKSALKFRLYGIKDIKLKVGDEGDIDRVGAARRFLGNSSDIRLDANCAWGADEAIEKLRALRKFNFSVIEQPVGKEDFSGLKKVSDAIPEPVMADESMCNIEDAEALILRKACKMFNIRISKCGGLLNSLNIAKLAAKSGILCQLGCHVGETGILSAAGRHFASCVDGIKYLEGSYAKFLLTEDIVKQDISFGYGGFARSLRGNGLGVTVDEKALDKYAVDRVTIK